MAQNETPSKPDQMDLLKDLKKLLRREVLSEVLKSGLTDSIITEYRELAKQGVRLLTLLDKYGFANVLTAEDRKEFEAIMQALSVSGLRCQILVEESCQNDYEAFLAVTPSASVRAN